MANYGDHVRARAATPAPTKAVAQNQPRDERQHQNAAGGYVYSAALWQQVERFLILGAEGGTYYAGEKELTIKNVASLGKALAENGRRLVDLIVEISDKGRAPKNDPALFALAYVASHGDADVKGYALKNLDKVARTATHLFGFVSYAETQRGWGRALTTAIEKWYNQKDVESVAFQMAKYQSRTVGGQTWAHRDVLRLAHVKPVDAQHNLAYKWAVGKANASDEGMPRAIALLGQFQAAQSEAEVLCLIAANPKSAWEFIPTQYLGSADVWAALLPNLPLGALVRNVARMTANGLLKPNSDAARLIRNRLGNQEEIRKARLHPIALLSAMKVYEQGHGERGKLTWTPVQTVTNALETAFYAAFGTLPKDSNRYGIGIDISGSMFGGDIAGIPGLTPAVAAAAMGMVIARTAEDYFMIGFDTHPVDLPITATTSLPDVLRMMQGWRFGGTDVAVVINHALQAGINVDKFVCLTDNETWAGKAHSPDAMRRYRSKLIANAKLIQVAMTATDSSVIDPDDALMLDVVGFDTATPKLIADF